MSEQKIIDGNKLIALFVGNEVDKPNNIDGFKKMIRLKSPDGKIGDWAYGHIPDFSKSWNWLMPVVVKIESNLNIRVEIIGYLCNIYKTTRDPSVKENGGFKDILLVSEKHNDKIMAIWLAVVRYIKKDFI